MFKSSSAFLISGLLLFVLSCGQEESDTNVVVNPDDDVQLEEEPGVSDSDPTVIVNNNIDNDVTVSSRTRVVDNDYHMRWTCRRAAPVVHRQYIHISVRCPTVEKDDYNKDGVLDEYEVEQAVGPKVLTLDASSGSEYTFEQRMPLSRLHQSVPEGQDFIVMIHGADQAVLDDHHREDNLTIPVACIVVKPPRTHDQDEVEYPESNPEEEPEWRPEEQDCEYDDQYDDQLECPYAE